jgi:cell division protease FtsH
MDKKASFNAWYLLIAVLLITVIQGMWQESQRTEYLPYSEFETYLRDGKIDNLTITETKIIGALKDAQAGEPDSFVTTRVDPAFAEQLRQYGVEFTGGTDSNFFSNLLSWVLPIAIFFGIWIFLLRRMAMGGMGSGGLMSIGKSKAKIYVEKDTKTTFEDVAGVEEAKAELKEVVDFLKDPQSYGVLGARLPRGVLLVGPPGTGKTLLARAVAGEAGVTFLSISGSEFVEMFVGVGAARVRDLFEQARKMAPCIIFIDELDAMGRARGIGPMAGGHDEKEQTLNQLLVELDGFDPSQGIILLAATNRPEILDPALLRPGRFDRQILVDRPDKQGRIQILEVHVRKVKLAPEVRLEEVAALTPGFTGADLANLVNEAALMATRRRADAVTMSDFTAAFERIVAGLEKRNRLLNPKERRVVAYHELGHALVALTLPGVDPVHKVSIIPRGVGALGYTLQRPTEDRFLMSVEELENKMAVLLGGRGAEQLVFGEISTGASDDLMKVTDIARSMVTRYGMDGTLGQAAYETERGTFLGMPSEGGGRRFSEATAREVDVAVRERIDRVYQKTLTILRERRGELESLAAKLLEKETLTADELPKPTPPPEAEAA